MNSRKKSTILLIIFFFAAHYFPGIWDCGRTLDIFKLLVYDLIILAKLYVNRKKFKIPER